MRTGRVQEVCLGVRGTISARVLVEGVEKTPSACTVTVYRAGSSLVLTATATISGSQVSYTSDWPSSTYTYSDDYRAVWTATVDGDDYTIETYFAVTPHQFTSALCDADLTASYPDLLTLASTASLATVREDVWSDIADRVRTTLKRPAGYVANPEILLAAHRDLCLARVLMETLVREPGDEWWMRAEVHREKGEAQLNQGLTYLRVDTDEDKSLGTDEATWATVRFER